MLYEVITKQLQDLSDEYHNGLQQIAQMLNRDEFQGVFNDKGLIDTNSSIIKLKNIINNYLETVAKNSELKLNQSVITSYSIHYTKLYDWIKFYIISKCSIKFKIIRILC